MRTPSPWIAKNIALSSYFRRASLLLALLALFVLLPTHAGAQARRAPAKPLPAQLELPEETFPQDDGDDPIGLDDDARTLDALATQRMAKVAEKPIDTAFGPVPAAPTARTGEVLTAIPAAREASHRVHVELAPGLATVSVEIALTSTSSKPCEARYRLAVPRGARLASLQACNAAGCRQGVVDRDHAAGRSAYDSAVLARASTVSGAHANARGPMPVAQAQLAADGKSIVMHAAPIVLDEPLTLTLRYEAEAPMHGGTVRFALPARGMDPRVAQTEVTLDARGLLDARVAGQSAGSAAAKSGAVAPLLGDAWVELPMTAIAPAAAPVSSSVRSIGCDDAQCIHARAWAGPRPLSARNIVLALDVSPSTEGPARGRLLAALAAVLEAAPPESKVRALAFAARSTIVLEAPSEPGLVPLAPFATQIQTAELGAATRFEAVWEHAEGWLKASANAGQRGLRPLIIVLGDGGITTGESDAFARAKRMGIEVAAINVADRSAVSTLRQSVHATGGVVIEAGASAELAATNRGSEQLIEQVSALFAPTVSRARVSASLDLGPLRAGEVLSFFGVRDGHASYAQRVRASRRASRAGQTLFSGKSVLVAVDERDLRAEARAHDWPTEPIRRGVCDRRGPAKRKSGLSSDAAPLALAEERPCAQTVVAAATNAKPASIGTGMPSNPLLDMLRQRVLPLARGCFRRDRAGRGQYARRALFVFSLAEREVISAHVEGRISDTLRECLLGAVDTLEVPRFTGTVQVSYPLVTESEPQAEQIALTASTAGRVDALLGQPPTPALPSSIRRR